MVGDAAQVDRGADDHRVHRGLVDDGLQLADLGVGVAHGRDQGADVGVALVHLGQGADQVGAGVDDLGGAEAAGGDHPGAVAHLAVGQGRAVLDHQDPLAGDQLGVLDPDRAGRLDHHRAGVELLELLLEGGDLLGGGLVDLVDDQHVGGPGVGLAGVVAGLVPGPQRVGDHDVQVGTVERQVVVAAVPQQHVGLGLGPLQDGVVVDPGVHDRARGQVGLVLLALLDGGAGRDQVVDAGEPLHGLAGQVAVGHRVADGHHLAAGGAQDLGHPPGRLGLARPGADGAHRHHRHRRHQLGLPRPEQPEVGPGGQDPGGDVHHVDVADVGVAEHHLVDVLGGDQVLEPLLGDDRDPLGVGGPGQGGRVGAVVDVGDLGGGERHHLGGRVATERAVEVVEVPPGGPHDDHPSLQARLLASVAARRWAARQQPRGYRPGGR